VRKEIHTHCRRSPHVANDSALAAQTSSESERLEKLERAVEQLQKRNAELEQEVRSLKNRRRF